MPVVTIGENTADDFAGCEDNKVKLNTPDNNYGATDEYYLSKFSSTIIDHGLCKFSGLSNISSPVTVNDATFYFYLTGYLGSGTHVFSLRQLYRNWLEGTQDGADRSNDTPYSSCWNEYGDENSWETAGGLGNNDRDNTSILATMSVNTTTGYKTANGSNFTAMVEDWINGDENNYGFHIERTDGSEDSEFKTFKTSEGPDSQRPYLSVGYTAGGGSFIIPITNYFKQMGIM